MSHIPTTPTMADRPAASLIGQTDTYVELPHHPRSRLDAAAPWEDGPDGTAWVVLHLNTPNRGCCSHAVPASAKVRVSVVGSCVSVPNLRPGDVVTNAPGMHPNAVVAAVDAARADVIVTFEPGPYGDRRVRLVYRAALRVILANR